MRVYLLVLLVAFIASCKSSGDFASNIQKRKYLKGYYFDRTQNNNKQENREDIESIVKAEIENPKDRSELVSGLSYVPLLISSDTIKKETPAEPSKTEESEDEYLIAKPESNSQNFEANSANPYEEESSRRKINPLSMISLGLLVLSVMIFWLGAVYTIIPFFFIPLITGIAALVTAILSLSISKYNDKTKYFGKGFSLAAVIGSGLFMVFFLIFLLILLFVLAILGAI